MAFFCAQRWKEEIFGIYTRVITMSSVFFPSLVCARCANWSTVEKNVNVDLFQIATLSGVAFRVIHFTIFYCSSAAFIPRNFVVKFGVSYAFHGSATFFAYATLPIYILVGEVTYAGALRILKTVNANDMQLIRNFTGRHVVPLVDVLEKNSYVIQVDTLSNGCYYRKIVLLL